MDIQNVALEMLDRITRQSAVQIARSTIPIYKFQNESTILLDRTGIFFQTANTYFILTASHGLSGFIEDSIPLFIELGLGDFDPIPLVDAQFYGTESLSSPGEQEIVRDVAAIRLPDATAQRLLNIKKEPITLHDLNPIPDLSPALFVIVGYPLANFQISAKGLVCNPLIVNTSLYDGPISAESEIGFDSNVHVLFNFERDVVNTANGEQAQLPEFDDIGCISGCGVWRVADFNNDALQQWNVSQCRLVAIQHRYLESAGYVHATWVKYAIGRIFDDHPELKPAAQLVYPSK